MTSKEKAKQLFELFYHAIPSHELGVDYDAAKQCALIAVDEILQADMFMMTLLQEMWWVEVRKEIEKL